MLTIADETGWRKYWPLIVIVLTILGSALGLHITQKDGGVLIVPETPGPAFTATAANAEAVAAKDPDRNRKILVAIARIKAGRQYAKEHELAESAGIALARAVPDANIDAALKAATVDFSAVPVGGVLSDFLAWLQAHPEIVQKIIEIILMLIPLFA